MNELISLTQKERSLKTIGHISYALHAIVAVADAYEVMTSVRAYKKAATASAAYFDTTGRTDTFTGGVRLIPTPDGVPVKIRSPGSSANALVRCSICAGPARSSTMPARNSWPPRRPC